MRNKDINECLKVNIQALKEFGLINNTEDLSEEDIKNLKKIIEKSQCFSECTSKVQTKSPNVKRKGH